MPQGHKEDCQCPTCKRNRKLLAQTAEADAERVKHPVVPQDSPEYRRLATDYEAALEQVRQFQTQSTLAQSTLDKASIKAVEMEVLFKRLRKQRNTTLGSLAGAVDLLRSTSITYHRAEGHRGDYGKCEDVICRSAAAAWYSIGELAGVELAKDDPDTWWDKKERNESIVASFADPETLGELEPEDVEDGLNYGEAFGYEEEDEEGVPESPGQVVDPSTLDELPDSPAFAGKKVRVLATSTRDADDPGMPKRARV